MEARRQPQKGAEGEYFLNPHNRQGSRLVPGGHTRAWGRLSCQSPHTQGCLSASGLGSSLGFLSRDWPKVTVMGASGA